MSDIQHKDIRFDCNMKEDIKREYTDLIRQRGYIKKIKIMEKITTLKRVEDLHHKCSDIEVMLIKRIRGIRLKIERTHI